MLLPLLLTKSSLKRFIIYILLYDIHVIYNKRRPHLTTDGSTEKPDPPIQVEGQDPTSKSITVTWKAPDYDGGCAIQGYILEKMIKDGDRYERINPSLVPGFSYVVKDLKEDMEYQFRVRAENAAGVSEPSRSTPLIKAADPVGKYWTLLA